MWVISKQVEWKGLAKCSSGMATNTRVSSEMTSLGEKGECSSKMDKLSQDFGKEANLHVKFDSINGIIFIILLCSFNC